MKITHNKVGQNLNLSDSSKAEKTDKAGKAGAASAAKDTNALDKLGEANGKDGAASKVAVSSRAQDMKRIKEIANSAPDIDEAKVAKFQKLIDDGKYKVDAEAVADRLVDEHIMYS